MSSSPSVDDLRLVLAVRRNRSVGAAARELMTSQPSASQRLAALERRSGQRLFDRDTTGARPTAAGVEFAARAEHILGHLDEVFEQVASAATVRTLSVGTFPSLAMLLFPALEEQLADVTLHQVSDHGHQLLARVEEGSLDACVVAVAGQVSLPRGVAAVPLGRDRLAVLHPEGAPRSGRGRRPYAGSTVIAYTVDGRADELRQRLAELGADVKRAATAETAVRLGRRWSAPVVMPHSLARAYATPREVLGRPPLRADATLFLVARNPAPPELTRALPALRRELGLTAPSTALRRG